MMHTLRQFARMLKISYPNLLKKIRHYGLSNETAWGVCEFRRIAKLVGYKVDGLILVPGLEPQRILDYLDSSGVPTGSVGW